MQSPLSRIVFCLVFATLFIFSSCTQQEETRLNRTERKVLLLRDPHHEQPVFGSVLDSLLRQYQADTSLEIISSYDYDQLDEENIHFYSAVLLTDLREDSLKNWHRTGLQRYIQAGNGVLIADPDSIIPMEWYWYQQAREEEPTSDLSRPYYQAALFDGGRIARLEEGLDETLSYATLDTLLRFLIADNQYDPTLIRAPIAPKYNRFTRHVLDDQIYEPMEMEILPNGLSLIHI